MKLKTFHDSFINLLAKFNYQSKDKEFIKISFDKYLPVIEIPVANAKPKIYDIRFDSSGSDLIRCLWAFYVALFKTSVNQNGCHPLLLLFDEPQQQSASTKYFHDFLKQPSEFKEEQVIVFASFQNSDIDYAEATNNVPHYLVKGEYKFIKKLETT